jgi:hypothetical protein
MKKKLQTTLSSKTRTITKAPPPTKLAKPQGNIMVKRETPVQVWFQFGIPQGPTKTFATNKATTKSADFIKDNKDMSKSDTSGSSEEPTLCEDQGVFSKDVVLEQVAFEANCVRKQWMG